VGLANVFEFELVVGRVAVGTRPPAVFGFVGAPMLPALMGVCAAVGS
jgi:hypothetical protein